MQVRVPEWFYWGSDRAVNATDRRKVFNTNLSVLIALVTMTFYDLVYAASGNAALWKVVQITPAFYVSFLAIPWINRYLNARLASWLFCITLTVLAHVVMWVGQGTYVAFHYHLVLFALAPTMFLPLKQWGAVLFFFGLDIGTYLIAEHGGVTPDPAMLDLPTWLVTGLRACHLLTSMFTLLFIVWLSEYAASDNEAQLEALSTTDPLTGIPNRRHLFQVLDSEWGRSARHQCPMAVAMIDVDRFKKYNDHYGHQAGDECLRSVARALRDSLRRSGDFVARYGGEEFVIVMPDTDQASALHKATTVCAAIRALNLPHAQSEFEWVTVSVGVAAAVPQPDGHINNLLQSADAALYQAKQAGRNQAVAATST